MAAPKKKKLTQREKTLNARDKKQLQEEGVLPPDKPKLNRKKFAKEVLEEWGEMDTYGSLLYLQRAIGCMVSADMRTVDAEQVGVLKLLKIALETQKFMKELEEKNQTTYTIGEYIDKVVLPIRKL